MKKEIELMRCPKSIQKQLDKLKEWKGEPRYRVIERLLKTREVQLK